MESASRSPQQAPGLVVALMRGCDTTQDGKVCWKFDSRMHSFKGLRNIELSAVTMVHLGKQTEAFLRKTVRGSLRGTAQPSKGLLTGIGLQSLHQMSTTVTPRI